MWPDYDIFEETTSKRNDDHTGYAIYLRTIQMVLYATTKYVNPKFMRKAVMSCII
jgi:hypothetical protein